MAERHEEMRRITAALPEGACKYGWYSVPEGVSVRDMNAWVPEVCGATPAEPIDAPIALKFGTDRVCEKHRKQAIVQEQLACAMDADGEVSRRWLVDNGFTAPTEEEMFGDEG